MAKDRCPHPGCGCEGKPEHQGYCSAECAAAGRSRPASGTCGCGHPGCEAQSAK